MTHLKETGESISTLCGATRPEAVLYAARRGDVDAVFNSFEAGGVRLEGVAVSPAGEPDRAMPNVCRRCARKAAEGPDGRLKTGSRVVL